MFNKIRKISKINQKAYLNSIKNNQVLVGKETNKVCKKLLQWIGIFKWKQRKQIKN